MLRVAIEDGRFLVDGQPISINSGSFHYWRHDPAQWPGILDRIKELNITTICTYIPWSVHEVRKGVFDFGDINPRKNLARFLQLCEERKFWVFVRPGPHINAELTYFGFPKRVLFDEAIQARDAGGEVAVLPAFPKPFPIPSYASEKLYAEVATYFDALCPILQRSQWPSGRIIGIQSDNEQSYFFRDAPFDLDYCDASLQLYRRFLKEKYTEIACLNDLYGTRFVGFDSVIPPRTIPVVELTDLRVILDWLEYKEYYLVHGVERVAHMIRERGIEKIPVFHNYPLHCDPPLNVVEMERAIDYQGIDLYLHKEGYNTLKHICLQLAGTSRFPFLAEFGAGVWVTVPPPRPHEEEFLKLSALMHGIKGMNHYMAVERDRWTGSPIKQDGTIREDYFSVYKNLGAFISQYAPMEFDRVVEILLVRVRDYDRLSSAATPLNVPFFYYLRNLLHPFPRQLPPVSRWIGFDSCLLDDYLGWIDFFETALSASGYGYNIGDTELDLEELSRYKVIILPTFSFLNVKVQKRLLRYVSAGGTAILGPEIPTLNEFIKPMAPLSSILEKPVGRLSNGLIDGVAVRRVRAFSAPSLIQMDNQAVAYRKKFGRGQLIHLGFAFEPGKHPLSEKAGKLARKILSTTGVESTGTVLNPLVNTALHRSKDGRELIYISNPTPQEQELRLETLSRGRKIRRLWSRGSRLDAKSGTPILHLSPYTVIILEVSE